MAPRRCFSCCVFGSKRQVRPDDASEAKTEFSPQCSCKAFRETGSCRHLPPPDLIHQRNAAPRAETPFSPKCTCKAFQDIGTCRHLPPPLPAEQEQQASPAAPQPAVIAAANPHPPPTGLDSLPVLELPSWPEGHELHFGEVLGRGASGATVLRCVVSPSEGSTAKPVPCAAKLLPLSRATFADMVEEFGREIALMQGLQHPCLIGFVGARHMSAPLPIPDAEEAYVLCLELCDVALDTVIRNRRLQGKPFSPEELGTLLVQVAAGLAYLHERRILHRDMKAANIFLQRRPEDGAVGVAVEDLPLSTLWAKLGDLGSGKVASRAQTPVQTPQWMAPEAMRLEGYGQPADIWGLGMVIYELLELSVPFGEEINMDHLEREVVAGHRPPLSDFQGAEERVPAFVALMEECLNPNPADRPRAADVYRQLQEAGWDADEYREL